MYDVAESSTDCKQNLVNDTIAKPTQEENALLGTYLARCRDQRKVRLSRYRRRGDCASISANASYSGDEKRNP